MGLEKSVPIRVRKSGHVLTATWPIRNPSLDIMVLALPGLAAKQQSGTVHAFVAHLDNVSKCRCRLIHIQYHAMRKVMTKAQLRTWSAAVHRLMTNENDGSMAYGSRTQRERGVVHQEPKLLQRWTAKWLNR